MIRTKDLVNWMQTDLYADDSDMEYVHEIIKRLRAYDRICRDLKQLIATLSNGVDNE